MGKFHDLLDNSGDDHMIAKSRVEAWFADFVLEYSQAGSQYDRIQIVKRWFG